MRRVPAPGGCGISAATGHCSAVLLSRGRGPSEDLMKVTRGAREKCPCAHTRVNSPSKVQAGLPSKAVRGVPRTRAPPEATPTRDTPGGRAASAGQGAPLPLAAGRGGTRGPGSQAPLSHSVNTALGELGLLAGPQFPPLCLSRQDAQDTAHLGVRTVLGVSVPTTGRQGRCQPIPAWLPQNPKKRLLLAPHTWKGRCPVGPSDV